MKERSKEILAIRTRPGSKVLKAYTSFDSNGGKCLEEDKAKVLR